MAWREKEIYTQAASNSSSFSNWDTITGEWIHLGHSSSHQLPLTQFLANNPAEWKHMSNPRKWHKRRGKIKKCLVYNTHFLNSWPAESWANKNSTDVKPLNIRVVCWATEDNKTYLTLIEFHNDQLYCHLHFRGLDMVYHQLAALSEKALAPHASTLAWKLPWTEEPGGLQSMGSLGVGHDWAT